MIKLLLHVRYFLNFLNLILAYLKEVENRNKRSESVSLLVSNVKEREYLVTEDENSRILRKNP